MARPKKERVICSSPRHRQFCPKEAKNVETVRLNMDEYEVLRLHDLEHLTQTEVAAQMLISRTSVTMLINSAHEKIADMIVNGKQLEIGSGHCAICEIGSGCPHAKNNTCSKKHHCAASCRRCVEQNGITKPEI